VRRHARDEDEAGRMLDEAAGGSVAYSRPEVPERGRVTGAALVLGVLALLCAGAVFLFLRETLRDRRRRRP
jgi:uncharacterized protein involved in exopolysaccharide biosynthesis